MAHSPLVAGCFGHAERQVRVSTGARWVVREPISIGGICGLEGAGGNGENGEGCKDSSYLLLLPTVTNELMHEGLVTTLPPSGAAHSSLYLGVKAI